MKRIAFFLILLIATNSLALESIAQKVYTIHVGNERLMVLCERLIALNTRAQSLNEVEPSFTEAMTHKLDSIQKRGEERRLFIKELKKVNASTLPNTFRGLSYAALNNRLAKEHIPLANDFAYCNVLQKILALTKKFKKNKKVYYASGKYAIPPALQTKAKEIFEPVIDNLIRISNQFKDLPFTAVVQTTGYSDSKPITPGSALYWDMAKRLQSEELTSAEIHTYLSYMRSYDVSELLRNLMKEKNKHLFEPQQLHIDFKKIGLGSQLPEKELENLPSRKRRVVKVYWHILPNF